MEQQVRRSILPPNDKINDHDHDDEGNVGERCRCTMLVSRMIDGKKRGKKEKKRKEEVNDEKEKEAEEEEEEAEEKRGGCWDALRLALVAVSR